MIDPFELNYQYRKYRADTDAHFEETDDPDDREGYGVEDEDEDPMAATADYADAADHLRRFIIQYAKKKGVPSSERDDVAGDALLEIAGDLGRQQFEFLLESIDMSDRIVDAFKESRRGRIARTAIGRVMDRFKPGMPTCTDLGLTSAIYRES